MDGGNEASPPGAAGKALERCAEHGLALRDDGRCIRCDAPPAPSGGSRAWIAVALALALGAAAYFMFLRGGSESAAAGPLRSPFDRGISAFVKVEPLAAQWARTGRDAPALRSKILQATGLDAGFFVRLAGVHDFEIYFDLADLVVRVRAEDAARFASVQLPGSDQALDTKQSGGSVFVGTARALDRLPAPGSMRAISVRDMNELSADAFIGLVWHERGERLMSLDVTPRGTCMTARALPVTQDMKAELAAEAARDAIQVVFDKSPSGEPRLCFHGEPFSTIGLAAAILIPAMMKYRQR